MTNYRIATYNLSEKKYTKNSNDFDSILRKVIINYTKNENCEISRLKKIVRNAIDAEEDVIIIYKDSVRSYANLIKIILNIHKLNYSFLLLAGSVKGPVVFIDSDSCYVSSLDSIEAFLITRSLYYEILQIPTLKNKDVSIEDIFNLMIRKKCALSACISKDSNITKLNKINIIIPLRNIAVYIKELCDSILSQRYEIYHVYFLDDNSDDNFTDLLPDILPYTVIKSTVQRFALENIIDALLNISFDNDDIIMLLDGDDVLAHEYVFEIINEAYNLKTIMATHGSFALYHTKQPFFYSYTREQFNKLRKVGWNLSPLRTFKFGLFSTYLNLDPTLSHMKDHEGFFYKTTYDMALFFPLLEICGYDRLKYIEDVLYYYRIHERNDFIINRSSQFANELEIRKKQLL